MKCSFRIGTRRVEHIATGEYIVVCATCGHQTERPVFQTHDDAAAYAMANSFRVCRKCERLDIGREQPILRSGG